MKGLDYTPLSTQDPNESEEEEELFPSAASNAKLTYTRREYLRQMLNLDQVVTPTPLSSHVAAHSAVMFALMTVPFSMTLQQPPVWYNKFMLSFMGLKMATCLVVLFKQPADTSSLSFKVPAGNVTVFQFK